MNEPLDNLGYRNYQVKNGSLDNLGCRNYDVRDGTLDNLGAGTRMLGMKH